MTIQSQEPKLPDVTSSLLSGTELSVERLPMLQILFEQVCDDFLEKIKEITDAQIDFSLERIWTSNICETGINNDQHIIVPLEISKGEAPAIFSIDRSALYLLLECMLGASGKEKPYIEKRDLTVLEFLFAETVAKRAGMAFCDVFKDIIKLKTTTCPAVKGSLAETLSDEGDAFLVASVVLDVFDRSGSINLLIPQSIIANLKKHFLTVKPDDPLTTDHPWQEHIKTQLQHTHMLCQASLDGGQISLDSISRLQVGQLLELDIPADRPICFSSGKQDLFWCKLGQSEGVFTLKVTEPISEKKHFLDEVLKQQYISHKA